ncbi:MAG TPA: phosphodiester glycosidase family protein [Anaerolineales bacterium]|nr:phosphodiester glycosidase family protein [Anaerolineales bacterium]
MKKAKLLRALFVLVGLLAIVVVVLAIYDRGRPAPVPMREKLFDGVTYTRMVRLSPRPLMIHAITIDLKVGGIHLLVTPADEKGAQYPLRARTTSQFLQQNGLQLAINGDGFAPWWSHSVADYYPHVGDPVQPRGNAASRGRVYWTSQAAVPTLYINSRNGLSFDAPAHPYNAISGETLLLMGGQLIPDLNDTVTQPRSAVGFSKNGRYLYLVVVDGRQPLYSEGMTLKELAGLMQSLGANYAMNLDGGGSSTLVVQGSNGRPRVLNSPIDNYIPGRERPVANHLGVFVEK